MSLARSTARFYCPNDSMPYSQQYSHRLSSGRLGTVLVLYTMCSGPGHVGIGKRRQRVLGGTGRKRQETCATVPGTVYCHWGTQYQPSVVGIRLAVALCCDPWGTFSWPVFCNQQCCTVIRLWLICHRCPFTPCPPRPSPRFSSPNPTIHHPTRASNELNIWNA